MQLPTASASHDGARDQDSSKQHKDGHGKASRWQKRANKRPLGPLPRQLEALREAQGHTAERHHAASPWAGLTIISAEHPYQELPRSGRMQLTRQETGTEHTRTAQQIRPGQRSSTAEQDLHGQQSFAKTAAGSREKTDKSSEMHRETEPEGQILDQGVSRRLTKTKHLDLGLNDTQQSVVDRREVDISRKEAQKRRTNVGQGAGAAAKSKKPAPQAMNLANPEAMEICGSSAPGLVSDVQTAPGHAMRRADQEMARGTSSCKALLDDSQATCDSSAPASGPQMPSSKRSWCRESQEGFPSYRYLSTHDEWPSAADLDVGGRAALEAAGLASPTASPAASDASMGVNEITSPTAPPVASIDSMVEDIMAGGAYLKVSSHAAEHASDASLAGEKAARDLNVSALSHEAQHAADASTPDNKSLLGNEAVKQAPDAPEALQAEQGTSLQQPMDPESVRMIPETLLDGPLFHETASNSTQQASQIPGSKLEVPHGPHHTAAQMHPEQIQSSQPHQVLQAGPDAEPLQTLEVADDADTKQNVPKDPAESSMQQATGQIPRTGDADRDKNAHIMVCGESVCDQTQMTACTPSRAAAAAAEAALAESSAGPPSEDHCDPKTPEASSDHRAPSGSICLDLPGLTVRSIQLQDR